MERSGPDYYRVLQVDPAANALVIQAAYRVLAQIWHPDVSGDDAEMKRLNAAWEILGDPRRRKHYDLERAGRHPGGAEMASATAPAPARPSAPSTAGSRARTSEARAGPPLGEPFGPLLRFGRYEGWTLGQVSRVDRAFLEWLRSAPAGRGLKDEIDAVLRSTGIPGVDRRGYDSERQQQVHAWAPGAPTKVR